MADKSLPTTSTREATPESSQTPSASASQKGLFPWLEDTEHQSLSLTTKAVKHFPLLGAVGIVGSAVTCFLSWLMLFLFDGHKVITHGHMPKPAAWLSVILSLNGILVHMAVSQGIAVTWWYRVSRKNANVAELHNTWATGTSAFSAATIWKAFNFVALATIFVATLPINGILLQNAVTSGSKYQNISSPTTTYALASELPPGYSAQLNEDGSLGLNNLAWQTYMPTVINNADGISKSNNTLNSCTGTCSAILETVGFNSTCINSTTPYSLPFDNEPSNSTDDTTIFDVSITWDPKTPNNIFINTVTKPTTDCSGNLQIRNCTSTTFGGIASGLSSYFDSSIVFQPTGNSTSMKLDGFYAQQLQPSPTYDENGTIIAPPSKCNESYSSFGWRYNPSDYILDQIHTALFFTSISIAETYTIPADTNNPIQSTQHNTYK